jgi:hypothetical protein
MVKKSVPRKRPRAAEVIAAPKKGPPYAFVLDELDALEPHTRPMFGCTAVYVGERIVLILRERPSRTDDNGVWVAIPQEHHAALRKQLPSLRAVAVLAEQGSTGWQNLPADGPDFEDEVLRVCALVRAGDPRIGRIPKRKSPTKKR